MNRLPKLLLSLFFTAGLLACGGGKSGFLIPTDTALNPFVAPEAGELIADEGADDEEEEEYEDYEDEEGEAQSPPASAPTPAK